MTKSSAQSRARDVSSAPRPKSLATAQAARSAPYAGKVTGDAMTIRTKDGASVAFAQARMLGDTPVIHLDLKGKGRRAPAAGSAAALATIVASKMTLRSGKKLPLLISTVLVSDDLKQAYDDARRASGWNYDTGVVDPTKMEAATEALSTALAREFPDLGSAGYDFKKSASRSLNHHYRRPRYVATDRYVASYDLNQLLLLEPVKTFVRPNVTTPMTAERVANPPPRGILAHVED
ncbi:MAG: hypothetical protein IPL79_15035 [Myxococcales bacterium]|nr:hypothetical protein [Myxococcales bacterium]